MTKKKRFREVTITVKATGETRVIICEFPRKIKPKKVK